MRKISTNNRSCKQTICPLICTPSTVICWWVFSWYQESHVSNAIFTKKTTSSLGYQALGHVWLCGKLLSWVFVYRGAQKEDEKESQKENGQAYTVVEKLLEMGNYLNKGYHVYLYNFFSSVPLARYLYYVWTYITGTIRINPKILSKSIKTKFGVGITKFSKMDISSSVDIERRNPQKTSTSHLI